MAYELFWAKRKSLEGRRRSQSVKWYYLMPQRYPYVDNALYISSRSNWKASVLLVVFCSSRRRFDIVEER